MLAAAGNLQALVLALAALHVILDPDAFRESCIRAIEAAEAGFIVTFGISPHEPRSSYGHILPGEPFGASTARTVSRCAEKPDARSAAEYVAQGYLWNSGNLLFRADVLLSDLARFEPDMTEAINSSVPQATKDLRFIRLGADAFARAPPESIRLRRDGTNREGSRYRWQVPLV